MALKAVRKGELSRLNFCKSVAPVINQQDVLDRQVVFFFKVELN